MTEGDTLSYWADTAPRYKPEPSDLPAKTDVIVVGGGYTGISAARVLAERGASVTLLEARDLGWGASTRNAGMMIVGLKHGPQVLVKQFGEELGRKLFDTTLEANRFVEEMIKREQIDCEYGRVGHLVAAFRARDYDSLEREAEFLDRRFNHQAEMVSRADLGDEIGTSFYHGGVIDNASAGLHPAKYFAGLARLADRAGAKLHPNTPATSVERVNGEFVVRTPRGEVRAKDVLVATNGYTSNIFPEFQRRVIPMGSYMIATEPLDSSTINRIVPKNRMVLDTKHVLYYFRRTVDNRLIFGGRASFTPTTVERSRDILRSAMRKVFPEIADARIDYAWKGNVAFTFDLLPHVGRHQNGMHYAIGFCGHGVAMGSYLGSRMGAMIASSEAPALPFFSMPFPSRFFYRGTPWFLPVVGTWYRFLDAI